MEVTLHYEHGNIRKQYKDLDDAILTCVKLGFITHWMEEGGAIAWSITKWASDNGLKHVTFSDEYGNEKTCSYLLRTYGEL